MSLTNTFKTVSNGVPYLAAKSIAQTILDFLATKEWNYKQQTKKQLELPFIFF